MVLRIFVFILIYSIGFSQDLLVTAVYFDKNGTPYKIEKKYVKDNEVIYTKLTPGKSVCIKKSLFYKKDTVIVEDAFCNLLMKKRGFDLSQKWDEVIQYVDSSNGTVKLSFYDMGNYIGDTILTEDNAQDFFSFYASNRIQDILDNKVSVNLDSLVVKEIVRIFYVNGEIVKIEVLDGSRNIINSTNCNVVGTSMICKSYFTKDKFTLYKVDTIRWNKDTTEVEWNYVRMDWQECFTKQYRLNKKELIMNAGNYKKTYVNCSDMFKCLLENNLVYNDLLYHIELFFFDNRKPVSIESASGMRVYHKYFYDSKKRVVKQEIYENNKLTGIVKYKY